MTRHTSQSALALRSRQVVGSSVDRHCNLASGISSALLDVKAVAKLLACSTRHVYRLSDSGRMPSPLRVGALVRWRRSAIEEWIAAGCPKVRHVATRN